jgi:hypothetical protein
MAFSTKQQATTYDGYATGLAFFVNDIRYFDIASPPSYVARIS